MLFVQSLVVFNNMRFLLVLGRIHRVLLLPRHDLTIELELELRFLLVVRFDPPLELYHRVFDLLAITALTFGASQQQLLAEQFKRQVFVLHVHLVDSFLYLNFLFKLLAKFDL